MTLPLNTDCPPERPSVTVRLADWLVIVMLLLLAAFLGFSYLSGRVSLYVASYYVWMTPATAIVLLGMATACVAAQFSRPADSCHSCGDGGSWTQRLCCVVILIVPIVFALAVNPQRPSSRWLRKHKLAAPPRDLKFERAVAWVLGEVREETDGGDADRVELPAKPTVLDILSAANRHDPVSLEGKFVEIVGQCDVVGGPQNGRFDVYRLVVTCCVADASAVSIEVAAPAGVKVEPGSWVRVAGRLRFDSSYSPTLPVLHAEIISRIPAPSEPYLSTPS
jgi:uncharacterized repeat protein (TIGR03943 family)